MVLVIKQAGQMRRFYKARRTVEFSQQFLNLLDLLPTEESSGKYQISIGSMGLVYLPTLIP